MIKIIFQLVQEMKNKEINCTFRAPGSNIAKLQNWMENIKKAASQMFTWIVFGYLFIFLAFFKFNLCLLKI